MTTRVGCLLAVWTLVASPGRITASPTPREVVQAFFSYLAASDTVAGAPDIGTDESAPERWLAQPLRQELRRANDYIRSHHPKADDISIQPINNASFRFAWDPPQKCVITDTITAPYSAIVAVKWIWGPHQEYAGSVQRAYFILTLENGAWRVLDIQPDPYKFNQSKSSLVRTLNSFR